MTDSSLADRPTDAQLAMARRAKMSGHAWRSLGVGGFTAWAVAIDRMLHDRPVGWVAIVTALVCGAVAWFLIGSGSGILWSYLPRSRIADKEN